MSTQVSTTYFATNFDAPSFSTALQRRGSSSFANDLHLRFCENAHPEFTVGPLGGCFSTLPRGLYSVPPPPRARLVRMPPWSNRLRPYLMISCRSSSEACASERPVCTNTNFGESPSDFNFLITFSLNKFRDDLAAPGYKCWLARWPFPFPT